MAISLATEAAAALSYPAVRFNNRERVLLSVVKTYVDANSPGATVGLSDLETAVAPSHVVKYAGEVTWSGSGATLAATVSGVLATDIVVASIHTLGTEGTILQGAYASAADTITFTLDAANTSNDAIISYSVLRATS